MNSYIKFRGNGPLSTVMKQKSIYKYIKQVKIAILLYYSILQNL